ncbi:MAG: hypothetical protein IJ045_00335 [Ruminiclostridium sp.]|nr:hypothetical protein [Ruminiclostridium sp.]
MEDILFALAFPFGAIIICIVVYIIARIYFAIRDSRHKKKNTIPTLSPEEQEKLNKDMQENPHLKEALLVAEEEIPRMEQSDIYKQICERIDRIQKEGDLQGIENAVTGVHTAGSMILLGSHFRLDEEHNYQLLPGVSYEQNKKACRFGESEDMRVDISPHLSDTEVIALNMAVTRYLDRGRGMYETEFFDLPVMDAPKKRAIVCELNLSDGTPVALNFGRPPFNTANSVLKKEFFKS